VIAQSHFLARRLWASSVGIRFAVRTVLAAAPVLAAFDLGITVVEWAAPLVLLLGLRLLLSALATGHPPWPGVVLVAIGEAIPAFGSRALYGPIGAALDWRIESVVGARVSAALATMPWLRLQDPTARDQLERLGAGAGAVTVIWDSGTALLRDCGRGLAAIVFLFLLQWPAAVLALVALAPAVALRRRAALEWDRVRVAETPERRRSGYLAGLLTGRAAAAEVRVFSYAPYILRLWREAQLGVQRVENAAHVRTARQALAADVATTALMAAAAAAVLTTGAAARAGSGLVALLTAFQQTRDLSYWVGSLTEENATAANLAEVLAWGSPLRPWPSGKRLRRRAGLRPAPSRAAALPVEGPVAAWRDATFRYRDAPYPAVHALTLEVRAGERLALVGPNGSGKTTAIHLLLGLLDPESGSVTRPARVGVVLQSDHHFALTAGENVGLGRPAAMHARTRTGGVLGRVGVDLSPDQPLGRYLRAGVEPSGGQWQRLALARALYSGSPLLILDEPTSGLDPLAEAWLYADFAQLAGDKTVIVVTHRLAAARFADRIAVFDQGRVVEMGAHATLLAQGGLYARMWAAQSGWAR
jgi:ABC-type multidrug transport system fused ATPase/permease subunit